MAFPFVFESNFEVGDVSEWDSETDSAGQLDVAHYTELARFPWHTAAPYRGAYCLRAQLSGGTADAILTAGDIDVAAGAARYFRFSIWFSPDFDATADDTVNLFELQSTGPVVEAAFGFRYVAATDAINLGIGETAPSSFGGENLKRGVWYTVELAVTLDSGGGNDGTIDLYVTPEGQKAATAVHATQVASLDQAAVIQGVLGVQDHLATTTGTILFDELAMDDARIYPITERYPEVVLLTKSGHAFVGDGRIANVTLLSGAAADNVLEVFDSDRAEATDPNNKVVELKNTASNETVDPAGMPALVIRGAYVQLSGTNPRALLQIDRARRSSATVRSLGAANA